MASIDASQKHELDEHAKQIRKAAYKHTMVDLTNAWDFYLHGGTEWHRIPYEIRYGRTLASEEHEKTAQVDLE